MTKRNYITLTVVIDPDAENIADMTDNPIIRRVTSSADNHPAADGDQEAHRQQICKWLAWAGNCVKQYADLDGPAIVQKNKRIDYCFTTAEYDVTRAAVNNDIAADAAQAITAYAMWRRDDHTQFYRRGDYSTSNLASADHWLTRTSASHDWEVLQGAKEYEIVRIIRLADYSWRVIKCYDDEPPPADSV